MSLPRLSGTFEPDGDNGAFDITISRPQGVSGNFDISFRLHRGPLPLPSEWPDPWYETSDEPLPWSSARNLVLTSGSEPFHLLALVTSRSSGTTWAAQVDAVPRRRIVYDEFCQPLPATVDPGARGHWRDWITYLQPQIGGTIGFRRPAGTNKVEVHPIDDRISIAIPSGDDHPPFEYADVWLETQESLWCHTRRVMFACHRVAFAVGTKTAHVDAFAYPHQARFDVGTRVSVYATIRFAADGGAKRFWRYRSSKFVVIEPTGTSADRVRLNLERSLGTTSTWPQQV